MIDSLLDDMPETPRVLPGELGGARWKGKHELIPGYFQLSGTHRLRFSPIHYEKSTQEMRWVGSKRGFWREFDFWKLFLKGTGIFPNDSFGGFHALGNFDHSHNNSHFFILDQCYSHSATVLSSFEVMNSNRDLREAILDGWT